MPFDQVVVATGARNRRLDVPGVDLPGVLDLRFAPDADAIRAAAAAGSKAVIVGMGFIGAEVAASLRQLGLDVTVVEFFGAPLERVLGPVLGGAIEALHRDHGVEMIFRDAAERFEGDGRFEALVTKEGRTIEADFAVVGVGVEPVTEVAEGGVPVDDGIPVDGDAADRVRGRVGDRRRRASRPPGVRPDPRRALRQRDEDGRTRREEPARRRGPSSTDPHWFWSDQYDANIQMAGFATEWDDVVVRGSIEDRSFSAFLLKDGQLLSTFSMNRKFDVRRSMPLIASKAHPDRAQLADPEFDLRQLHPPKEEAS